jgi:serine/threonine-protein kinase HipA
MPTTHILKPALAGFEDQHLNEHLCLSAARSVGLPAAVSTVEAFEDESAVVIERFDRATRGDQLVRVHQEDLCQALSLPPVRKYQSDGGPTPGRVAELLRTSVPGPDAETDVWHFADALAFNWLIAGTDAHAKNYGLLLAGTQVRLAPLYDTASYLPYDDSAGHKVKLAMKIGDDYRLGRTDRRSAWERTAKELRLDQRLLIDRVIDLAQRTPDAFALAAEGRGVEGTESDLPGRLVELVSNRCRHCIQVLA